ncbi:hypothetical protein ACFSKN_14845 [Mariniflexile gromovii]|uniref:Collagen triple helix repeat protein n=1 Tax=Mariniflexile gromovii TaxID=362523 RepID=A0ABS4BRN4_9FLAO|nr:hypothetical protein [Mariniflexile gromovii]MBP0903245.1 hypothetical protein [Mariniflexile gromovii]
MMKNSKMLISKSKYCILAIIVALNFACSSEDGTQGPEGPAGEDGNANVQTFVFNTSSLSGDSFILSLPEITQDVIDNDVVLGYITHWQNYHYPIPGTVFNGESAVRVYIVPSQYHIKFHNLNGTPYTVAAGAYPTTKIIIIKSSNTTIAKTSSKKNSKQHILNELNQNGVDINDYNAVCNYYGIKD